MKVYAIKRMPASVGPLTLAEALAPHSFGIVYLDEILLFGDRINELPIKIPGIELEEREFSEEGTYACLSVFPILPINQSVKDKPLAVVLNAVKKEEVEKVKKRVERELSSYATKLTKSYKKEETVEIAESKAYVNYDLYTLLRKMQEAINEVVTQNYMGYKANVLVLGKGEGASSVKSKAFVLAEKSFYAKSFEEAVERAKAMGSMPLSIGLASLLVSLPSNRIERVKEIGISHAENGIVLGRRLANGVKEAEEVAVEPHTLNLGVLITGMPGTGKTYEAMSIAGQVAKLGRPVVVITPTSEWQAFANANGLPVISLYKSQMPINFFKCDSPINIERFYENLATSLAIASDAGPYTRSLEKVLLAALKRAYAKSSAPDPLDVYDEIEEEVIEEHAKRNNVGVEYTKHGENVRAALQNLRLMLMRPEFAYQEGISFAELMKRGAVFDLSNVSNNMKQFYYALILNQAYSVLDAYDENGSNDLRTLLVLEEAQLALKSGEYNAAIVDMKQRIQDFRKKGIGLLLITHAATELSRELRRLCQTKLYFRQSADVAKYAIEDLALDKSSENEMLIKTIANRICLANYVKEGSIGMEVLKTNALYLAKEEKKQEEESIARGEEMTVQLLDPNGEPIANKRVQIYYAGEKLADLSTDEQGIARLGNTLPKRRYIVKVLGKKKKETITLTAIGGEKNAFSITQE